MSDIKLFKYSEVGASELAGKAALVEKELQALIEARMEIFFLQRTRCFCAVAEGRIISPFVTIHIFINQTIRDLYQLFNMD